VSVFTIKIDLEYSYTNGTGIFSLMMCHAKIPAL